MVFQNGLLSFKDVLQFGDNLKLSRWTWMPLTSCNGCWGRMVNSHVSFALFFSFLASVPEDCQTPLQPHSTHRCSKGGNQEQSLKPRPPQPPCAKPSVKSVLIPEIPAPDALSSLPCSPHFLVSCSQDFDPRKPCVQHWREMQLTTQMRAIWIRNFLLICRCEDGLWSELIGINPWTPVST